MKSLRVQLPKPRLYWIQGLRGICALGVVIGHSYWPLTTNNKSIIQSLAGTTGAKDIPFVTNRFMYLMWNSVTPSLMFVGAFFLISGFVVPGSIQKGVGHFWIGRFFRIFPVLWAGLLIVFLTDRFVFHGINFDVSTWLNCSFLIGKADVLSPIWSLVVEMRFYILILIWALFKWRQKTLIYFLAIMGLPSFYIANLFPNNYVILTLTSSTFYFEFIAIGMAFREYWESRSKQDFYLLLSTILILRIIFLENMEYAHPWIPTSPDSALYGALLIFVIALGLENLKLDCPSYLIKLGDISYSLYIVHLPIIYVLYIFLSKFLPVQNFILAPMIAIVLALGFSYLIHLLVERPANNFAKQISEKWLMRTSLGTKE